ncbi:MAG: hypothetical protein CVV64_12670 [Candidatus Wallbacteria bacterium HGW-Wallbacteria-1]|jgi:hypothetical protein|uniref:Uncharacterized protein n=1 Tax=Candidatus Wallbacteria bacterium HGW-Wallbacteria-1 TaxID=2013854 RepID=A0A2N1PN45_9BACT|nr:MAG: hypothetical protein CVV64_12670 [Candidatus Wallbacteria bacterium HGW-Wallbacteria-1]
MNSSNNYFWDGFNHFSFALFFVLILYIVLNRKAHLSKSFWIALVMGSSALFFLPPTIKFIYPFNWTIWHFLHFPLPDWDILIIGKSWHRYFLFHSAILPLILFYETPATPKTIPTITGALVGISSHLIWDGLTCAMSTSIVFYKDTLEISGYTGKGWLIVNGLAIMALAIAYARRNKAAFKAEI